MTLLTVVMSVAAAATVLSFFAASSSCLQIARKGSTAGFSVGPFFGGFFSTFLWLRYTLFVNDSVGVLVNSIGLLCFTLYTSFFYLYTPQKEQINKKIVALAGTIIVTVFSCNSSSDFVYFTGLTAAVASMLCALSPLPAVVDAVRSKSTEMLPFPIICSSVFVSSLWLLYGYLVGDPFVQITNIFNVIASSLQLSLFLIYPSQKLRKVD